MLGNSKSNNSQNQKRKVPGQSRKNNLVPNFNNQGILGNIFFYLAIFLILFVVLETLSGAALSSQKVPLSEVITLIRDEKVQDVVVSGDSIEVLLRDGSMIVADKESTVSFDEVLTNNDVDRSKISGKLEVEHRLTLDQILTPLLMFGLPVLILFFIMRQMRSAGGDILSFGRSRARLFNRGQSKVTFGDVAGNEEAKREMMEIVDFLKNPQKYRKLGARIPKGVLLVGSSGVGKTLLAKAIAGEANVPFFSAAGSEFMEMLVGVGSARVRDLFRMAKESQPSLIFIDEIDAIGRQRGGGFAGGHDEREQTLNQILIEMDGFDERANVIVLAATNRPDMLDPALVRPGRFDRRITIPLPDLADREEIIKIHIKNKILAPNVDITAIARKTVGFSGADLENMLNEAAILAARENKEAVEQSDIEEAALKVTIGSERRTMRTEEERKMTAYHEAGHAIVSAHVPEMDAVHRVSIVARGGSLGHTSFPPERDRYKVSNIHLQSYIATMLGGRSAEELISDSVSTGASDDIQRATTMARKMVTEYGMSDLGPVNYVNQDPNPFTKGYDGGYAASPEMAARIDAEIKKIIDAAHAKAKQILSDHHGELHRVAAKLLEKETIDGEEFRSMLDAPNPRAEA